MCVNSLFIISSPFLSICPLSSQIKFLVVQNMYYHKIRKKIALQSSTGYIEACFHFFFENKHSRVKLFEEEEDHSRDSNLKLLIKPLAKPLKWNQI